MTRSLLDRAFVRELEAIRRQLVFRGRSAGAGDLSGRRKGGTAEFEEHRDYDGDDARRIDWFAFARTGQPRVKVFREDEDVIVRLAIDASASMSFGEPSKFVLATKVAAALAYLALTGSDRTQVVMLGGDGPPSANRPVRGRAALGAVLRTLDQTAPGGALNVASAILELATARARPGTLVILGDFLGSGDIGTAIRRAAAAGHDVVLVQVLALAEIAPALEGDVTLVDSETGKEIAMTADGPVVSAYEARLAAHRRSLEELAHSCRGAYVFARSDEATGDVVRRIARSRSSFGSEAMR